MEQLPLVSVVMPVYNVEKYIEDSVRSVLRQTYKQLELIVVDDGSQDNSINKAKRLLETSQLRYQIISQKNSGLGAARNAGLKASNGEWVIFLDSDDMLSDNGIEHMVSVISQNIDMIFCDVNSISSSNEAIIKCESCEPEYISCKDLQLLFLKREKVVLAPGTLFRKNYLMENNLFFETIPWSEDQHFIWRVLYHIAGACYLSEPIYQYFHRPGSIMTASKSKAMEKSYKSICELSEYYGNGDYIGQYIVPRWVMGTMNASAKLLSYSDWNSLWNEVEASRHFHRLKTFPETKVRIISFIGCISPKIYYCILRRR